MQAQVRLTLNFSFSRQIWAKLFEWMFPYLHWVVSLLSSFSAPQFASFPQIGRVPSTMA
jgi:hypothetical protein